MVGREQRVCYYNRPNKWWWRLELRCLWDTEEGRDDMN